MAATTAAPSLITRLNREWQGRWAELEYDFPHGRMSCQQTLQIVSERRPEADAVLRGLLTAAAHDGANDPVCARTALQIILPRVVSVAVQCARRSRQLGHDEEPMAITVAVALERIKHAPLHRPGSALGNLAMDVLKYALRHTAPVSAETPTDPTEAGSFEPAGLEQIARGEALNSSTTEEATAQVLRLAAWARDREILTERETAMLVTYELGTCQERKAMAARYGIEVPALRLRVHRIRQSLKKAVQAHALERSDLMTPLAA